MIGGDSSSGIIHAVEKVSLTKMPGYTLSARSDAVSAAEQLFNKAQPCGRSWYFSKEEIEDQSPSRLDGIDYMQETVIREMYYSFLRELATKLQVGPVTTATALMLCHRFFMRQSLAKNDWKVIATSSMFLACKIEEDLHALKNLVVVSYENMHKWDPSASQRIKNKDFLSKQTKLIHDGERLILVTIAFNINIELPYKHLTSALKMLNLSENHVARTAWDFVNYVVRTTLCLQYKPPYVAAASLFLAAQRTNVKLPMDRENAWWFKFDVSPKELQVVVKDMHALLFNNKHMQKTSTPRHSLEAKTPMSEPKNPATSGSSAPTTTIQHNPESKSAVPHDICSSNTSCLPSLTPGFVSTSSVNSGVEESESACCTSVGDSKPKNATGRPKLDVARLKEAFRRTRSKRDGKVMEVRVAGDEENEDAWVAEELERGVEQEYGLVAKRRKM